MVDGLHRITRGLDARLVVKHHRLASGARGWLKDFETKRGSGVGTSFPIPDDLLRAVTYLSP